MAGNVHDEDVADAPPGAKPGLALHDRPQKLVGMQAALHQQLGLAGADQLDRLLGGGLAVRDVDDLDAVEVEANDLGDAADLVLGPDEDRHDESRLGRLERSLERGLVTGMGDRCRERR